MIGIEHHLKLSHFFLYVCTYVQDIKLGTLKKFVEYLYTDSCESLPESAGALLAAAEKYNVASLKDECEEALIGAIRLHNAG